MASWQLFLIHFLLSVVFFYILNWIGRHSVSLGYIQLSIFVRDDAAPAFNFILRTFSPTVYIIILSTIFYSVGFDHLVKDIWLIVVYYVLFRTFYNLIMGRALLINWAMQFAHWAISILLAYFVYSKIIVNKINLLPDFSTTSNELWLIILLYLYSVMNNIKTSKEGTRKRKLNYLEIECRKYKSLFSETINKLSKNNDVTNLIYAILIYENFARPKAFRFIENLIPEGFEITRGIMQVKTKEKISDLKSIELAIKKINEDYEKSLSETQAHAPITLTGGMPNEFVEKMMKDETITKTVAKYNKDDDYISEVIEPYRTLPKILDEI